MSFVVTTRVVREQDAFVVQGFIGPQNKFFATTEAFQDKLCVTSPPVAFGGPDGVRTINDPISVQVATNEGEKVRVAFLRGPVGGRGAELGDVPIAMAVGLLQRVIRTVGYSEPHATLPAFKLEETTSLPSVVVLGELAEDGQRGGFTPVSSRFEQSTRMCCEIEGAALSAAAERRLAHLEPPSAGSTANAPESKAESRKRAPLNPANLKVAYTPLRITNTRSTCRNRNFVNKHLGEVNHNRRYFSNGA